MGLRGDVFEYTSLSVAGLNADLFPAQDVSAYRWVSVQVTGTWVGTLTFQGSNDNATWTSVALLSAATATNTGAITTAANGVFHGPLGFRWFRVRMTSYTSGTATGVAELFTVPAALHTMGVFASQLGTWNVGMTTTATGNGNSGFHLDSAATTNATSVKASAGQVYDWVISNTSATVKYVKLYDKASAPTVGTDIPSRVIAIPATSSVWANFDQGIPFTSGIALAITGAGSDADTTAVAAHDVIVGLGYK